MRVLHLTAELWPYARTGGLGQAVAGIAAYQAAAGIDTNILLPLYREAREHVGALEPFGRPFTVQLGGVAERMQCWRLSDADPPTRLFLDHASSFDRSGIYGDAGQDYPDNHRRFALFALGAIEVARQIAKSGLILHAHDWHAALAAVYLRYAQRTTRRLHGVPCVVTVHNGGFQGVFPEATLTELGLPVELWSPDFMEWYGRLNYLKGGLVFADLVTTVSPTHAAELRTDVGGFGLQDVFRRLGDRLVGIRNGIDQFQWDPATDPDIAAHFDPDDLRGKAVCKAALQKAWNLPQRERVPLFAMSARLVSQKGVELILGSTCLRELDAQFVFLGEGEPRYEVALRDVAREHPGRVALNTGFTDALEHRLLAGADFLLMPSLYEPCGLTQMRAQLYGALPLARRVGGLADTIVDGETGILFDEYTPAAFDAAVRRAVRLYQDRAAFVEHARRAMRNDFSWSAPGAAYVEAYRRAITARAQRRPPGSPDEPPGSPGADEPARSRFRSMRDASISKVDLQAAR